MEHEMEEASARSPGYSARGVWFKDRAVGLAAFALVGAGQAAILLVYLFAPPDDPNSVLDVFERHWTDDLGEWWLRLSALAAGLALLGLFLDKKRDIAGAALAAAFIGFIWPWGA